MAILGLGAIGHQLLESLQTTIQPGAPVAALVRAGPAAGKPAIETFADTAALLRWKPDLAIECAGHEVVRSVVPALLRAGVDVILVSIGALGDAALRASLAAAATGGQVPNTLISAR